jgi:ADP-heptose:LPS heptosyltransferase
MEFTLHKDWNKALGTELILLSVLMDFGVKQLNINQNLNNKNFDCYKRIFNIQELKINQVDPKFLTNTVAPNDLFKIYSPYYKIPKVQKKKPFIGIASYQSSEVIEPNNTTYPNCKIYSIDQYAELYKFIKISGYDVISLDSRDISIEGKVHLITEFCECVIGYEGGLAHLCHMLNVPYIMFPWHQEFVEVDSKLIHLDNQTYFLDSFEELLLWSPKKLHQCIEELHAGLTNNELVHNPGLILDRLLDGIQEITTDEINFLNKKYPILK